MTNSRSDVRELSVGFRPRLSLLSWVVGVLRPSGLKPARHHELLLKELDALTRGDIDRLMVLMPPGSAKSTYTSVLFPAWWFVAYPKGSVIAASHTADLATHFGRHARTVITENEGALDYRISRESRSAGRWRTDKGGEYFATGIRGPLAGRRADLIIVDDPVKSYAEADSRYHRDRVWDWYRADLTTRLKPRGRLALVMTRWHEDDLAGRLLSRQPEKWRVVRLPAVAQERDALGRKLDEPLWPEWEGAAVLEDRRMILGARAWSALYQQQPRPRQGAFFRTSRIEVVLPDAITQDTVQVRAWDLAATPLEGASDPDWTVGLKLAVLPNRTWAVTDLVRVRSSPGAVEELMHATAKADGKSVRIGIPEDPGQAGKSQVSNLTRLLAGYIVIASRETGAKATRAAPIAAQVEAGNLKIVLGSWNQTFLEELACFPDSDKDDQVDALCRGFSLLTDHPIPARSMQLALFGR